MKLPAVALALLSGIAALYGLVTSASVRRTDRREYAGFVGYVAATVGLAAILLAITCAALWQGADSPANHPVEQGFVFILGWVWMVATAVTLVAGFFARSIRRITLILLVFVMGAVLLLAAFSNFGA